VTLNILLPEIVSTYGRRLFSFGVGLAEGCSDKQKLFHALYLAIEKTPPEMRQINVFLGFLSSCSESDPTFYNSTLDDLIKDDILGELFPVIQTTSTIDQRGVERLHESLDHGKAQIHLYQHLAWGRAHESITDDALVGLLRKILTKEGGFDVALEILKMRFHGQKKASPEYSEGLITIAREVMTASSFDDGRRRQSNHDYELEQVASICLGDPAGIPAATITCQNLKKAITENRAYSFDYPRLLNRLAELQPIIFLDVFLEGDDIEGYQRRRMFIDDIERHDNPLSQITDDVLLSWCEVEPTSRYPLVASSMKAFSKSDETGKCEWKPFVFTILNKSPDLEGILEHIDDALRPMSWSGSRADILERRSVLYQELYDHDNEEVAAWARSRYTIIQEEIRKEREREDRQDRGRNESFE